MSEQPLELEGVIGFSGARTQQLAAQEKEQQQLKHAAQSRETPR